MDPFLTRTWLRAVPGLPVPRLKSLVSWMIGLCSVAVFLGRAVLDSGSWASRAGARGSRALCRGRQGLVLRSCVEVPSLDTDTGEVMHGTDSGGLVFEQVSCSPWRDGQDQYHLAGRWTDSRGDARNRLSETVGMARYAFPEGRLLEGIGLEVTPIGRPCWFPDRSERVMFLGGDNRIYVYDLSTVRGGGGRDRAPSLRTLRWRFDLEDVATRWVFHEDLCWPSDPALGRRLLVAMEHPAVNSRTDRSLRLWWLELAPTAPRSGPSSR